MTSRALDFFRKRPAQTDSREPPKAQASAPAQTGDEIPVNSPDQPLQSPPNLPRPADFFRKRPAQTDRAETPKATAARAGDEIPIDCPDQPLKSSPSFPSFPRPGAASARASSSNVKAQPQQEAFGTVGNSGNSGNFPADLQGETRKSSDAKIELPRNNHRQAIDALRKLKNAGASVIWDGHESRIEFDATSGAPQTAPAMHAQAKAEIDGYLAQELPEFKPAERACAEWLMRHLAVELVIPIDAAGAAEAIAELIASSGDLGLVFDTETAALPQWKESRAPLVFNADGSLSKNQRQFKPEAPLDPHRSRIRLIQLAGVFRPEAPNRVVLIDADRIPVDHPALLPLWRSKLWIHNAAFDVKHLIAAGVDLSHAEIVDTMLLAGMVHRCEPDPRRPAPTRPSLAAYAKAAAGTDLPKSGQLSDWDRPRLSQDQLNYAALDVAVLAFLAPRSWARLPDEGSKSCVERASAAALAVARLELTGMAIDPARLREAAAGWEGQIKELEAKIVSAGGPERPNSPACVARWLANVLPEETTRFWPKTPTGALSTEAKILRRAVEEHPAIELLLARAKLAKMAGSFGQPLLEKINPFTGRLHANLKICGAKSGRFSCANPNLQQVPARGVLGSFMRSIFVAPPGRVLVGADYSQLELRVLAAVSGDAAMTAAFQSGQDLHALTACAMMGIDIQDFDADNPTHKAARASAKAVNFGIIYGCGAAGLAAFARDAYGVVMTQAEAAGAITRFLNTYEEVAEWMARAALAAQSSSSVRTAGGRIYPASYEPEGKISRQLALNLPIQGAAAEVALEAIIRLEKALRNFGDTRLVAQVHDEFLLEVEDDETCVANAASILDGAMREGFAALFPHAPQTGLVDVGVGKTWADLKR